MKNDLNSNLECNKTFEGNSYKSRNSIFQTADGGYLIIGDTSAYGAGGSDLFPKEC